MAAVTVIADSILPVTQSHPVVVLSSPDRVRLKFDVNSTRSYRKYYLPLPADEEIRDMARVAYSSDSSPEDVEARMQLWGPIPRLVLSEVDPPEMQEFWNSIRAISADDLVRLLECLSCDPLDKQELPHRLFVQYAAGQHTDPGKPPLELTDRMYYMKGRREVCSRALVRLVIHRTKSHVNFVMKLLVDSSAQVAPFGALRGIKFEPIALTVLEDGGRFNTRRLHAVSSPDAEHPPSGTTAADDGPLPGDAVHPHQFRRHRTRASCRTNADLATAASPGVMLVPENSSQVAIDGLIWDDQRDCYACVQVTVNKAHKINGAGLVAALRALGWDPEHGMPKLPLGSEPKYARLRFYWVVPEDDMNCREWQRAHHVSDEAVSGLGGIEQYVIGIPSLAAVEAADRLVTSELPDPEALVEKLCARR